ncbi:hypothetical protein [Moheibacter lacus]|uniref:Uncharacterized protein n=1 Tax=Moheibacter lacus TaxID=2745851 RepID=A0A838ZTS6_9FLAO|nr:hypothetical protein [Moheibacter lacus]MBA5630333.1 hypothetical protein [Moheibacter lacus]
MTLIVSWIGVDQKKNGNQIASLYIASDSRFSWGKNGKYDYGVKVFGCINSPEIFGFSGDVLLPSNIINQLITQIDYGIFFNDTDTKEIKSQRIYKFISEAINLYPKFALNQNFNIIYGTRISHEFKLFKYLYDYKSEEFTYEEIELPLISTKVYSGGSGAEEFNKNFENLERESHNEYRTSRGVYQCLIKTLNNMKDIYSGGTPQIVGLYRIKNSILFGSVINEKLYLYGREYLQKVNVENIEWRNENFERTNPKTGKILDGAQKQPN